jgi:hypothetical protein
VLLARRQIWGGATVIGTMARGYRGLATNTSLDLRVGYDPAHDSFWARIHTPNDQLLLNRTGLADVAAVERAVVGYGQVPGVVLSWLDRDRDQALEHARIASDTLLVEL